MNTQPSLAHLLTGYPAFEGMATADVSDIVSRARRIVVPRDHAVFDQGMDAQSFFFVIEGYVRVVRVQADGGQVVVRYFPAGHLIGIAPAMNLPVYPASAIAAVDCIVLGWPAKLWDEFCRSYPGFVGNVLRAVGQRLLDSQERLMEISTQRAEQRIARALIHIGGSVGRTSNEGFMIDFPLSRQDIAEMTATTLHTVSRLLAKWERAGFVRLGRQKVEVLSRLALARLAEAQGE